MVAKIVYRIVPLGKILADELSMPDSVIYSVQELTYFLDEVISDIFSQGISPLIQYNGLFRSGVPPAEIELIYESRHQHQLSGISNGSSSSTHFTVPSANFS